MLRWLAMITKERGAISQSYINNRTRIITAIINMCKKEQNKTKQNNLKSQIRTEYHAATLLIRKQRERYCAE
jgi:hypothetical protein